MKRVLIVGAGIAGPTLAYWLLRAGMTPTLVENAPSLRTGGYMIDFWGPGYTVAERMGIAPRLRQQGYEIGEIRIVDGRGRSRISLSIEPMRRALDHRLVSLLRGDLARLLYQSIEGEVETLFGEEIRDLVPDEDGVGVSFQRGRSRRFDLVIGADGLHSRVRQLMYPGRRCEYDLGYHVAAFTAGDYPFRDEAVYVTRTVPGRQVARCSLRDGRTVFFMVLASELTANHAMTSTSARRRALASIYTDIGSPEEDAIKDALQASGDLYFDQVSQIRMPHWSSGRVALVGDAACAPSLLAGEGASLAMAGAYILAGELASTTDAVAAFAAYEGRLRAFVEGKQRAARRMGGVVRAPHAARLVDAQPADEARQRA